MSEIDQVIQEAEEICKRIGARDFDEAIAMLEAKQDA